MKNKVRYGIKIDIDNNEWLWVTKWNGGDVVVLTFDTYIEALEYLMTTWRGAYEGGRSTIEEYLGEESV